MSVDSLEKYPELYLKIVSSNLNDFNVNDLNVFVEIEMNGKEDVHRTKVATSLQPIWEEEFNLKISSDDFLSIKLK